MLNLKNLPFNYRFMDNFTKLWTWLKTLPIWLRAVVLTLVAVLALIASMSFVACGTPKTIATVQNVNPNSKVSVTMTVSNSTTSTPTVETSTPSLDNIP